MKGMKSKIVIAALTAGLILGGAAGVSARTRDCDTSDSAPFKQKIEEIARILDTALKDEVAWELFKEIRQAGAEDYQNRVYGAAEKLNIPTKGRDLKDIAGDVRRAGILNAAGRLHVPTEGRTLEEIAGNVKEAWKDKKVELLQKYETSIRAFRGVINQ